MTTPHAWHAVSAACLMPETLCLEALRATLDADPILLQRISDSARHWIQTLREQPQRSGGVETLLREYRLSTPEGVALLCLAEALLRIPEPAVADALIRDLLGPIDWEKHVGTDDSLFINAANWGLALTGHWLDATEQPRGHARSWLRHLLEKLGEPVLRQALKNIMRHLARQFVLGEDLGTALQRSREDWERGYTHSYDMLGEAALTDADSARYLQAYREAIDAAGHCQPPTPLQRPGVSIKLSALHPRYQSSQWPRLQRELLPSLRALVEQAADANVDLAIDAEEADRLELSLQLFQAVRATLGTSARQRLGIVVQAYGKRAWPVLQWLADLADHERTTIKVRLVKGAYWDTEIKRAQVRGLSDYPVFTDKTATDISYLACAYWMLRHPQQIFPQFATHNAVTIAAILAQQPEHHRFELQRLHGMGAALYDLVREQHNDLRYRIYAPVGAHRELLPYLVRRLLENGANTSFVHHLSDPATSLDTLARHPLQSAPSTTSLPLPGDLWLPRKNSPGIYLHTELERRRFLEALHQACAEMDDALSPMPSAEHNVVHSPTDDSFVGQWRLSDLDDVSNAIAMARARQRDWQRTPVTERAACLERYADLLVKHRAHLVALMARETGKTLENGLEEVREAVDFCRYYAGQARQLFGAAQQLPSPVGESNQLLLEGHGIFVCISPWNFPLSIFIGQIAAALVAGNAVLAKPAEQATLTALYATDLFENAGLPEYLLQTLPGPGETIGAALCGHPGIDGIVFTGGWDTARAITRQLAQRDGAIIPFIAETAGLNALIADSSALPQQLVLDVLRSAFDSAGQRCSALRVLYLPERSADLIESLLCGAIRELRLGDPLDWSTDIGPIIDRAACAQLREHIDHFRHRNRIVFQGETPAAGLFVAPTLIRLTHFGELEHEAFGPILHIIRYAENRLDAVIEEINAAGFGLTCGIHSRNEARARAILERLRVGNGYINRDLIGAAVGVQPFGGCGKSGTGPKAGGPYYLLRFAQEKTVTVNTAALGGDRQLLAGKL